MGQARDRPGAQGARSARALAGLPQGLRGGESEARGAPRRHTRPDARVVDGKGPQASAGQHGHAAGRDQARLRGLPRRPVSTDQAVSADDPVRAQEVQTIAAQVSQLVVGGGEPNGCRCRCRWYSTAARRPAVVSLHGGNQ